MSRQYASGGSDIARAVAARLGWTLIDHEFVDRVAQRVGLSEEEVADRQERVTGLIERLARSLAVSSPEVFIASGGPPPDTPIPDDEIFRVTEAVINEAVQQDNVVMVGRGAQAYLGQRADTLHLFVVAPLEVRLDQASEQLGMSRKQAEKKVADVDHGRRHYVETHYGRTWDDPSNYHLVINSALVSTDETVDLVESVARDRGW